jgi:hypothetical protein
MIRKFKKDEPNVFVVGIKYVNGKRISKVIAAARNIVTDAGIIYYAQLITGETPTNTFNTFEFGTDGDVPAHDSNRSNMTDKVTDSQFTEDTGYPKRDDDDPDNPAPGENIITHKCTLTTSRATSAFPTFIDRGIITNPSPGASEPVLAYFVFDTPFQHTTYDVHKIFENHPISIDV